ncbi:MAG: hypothetical protein AB7J32_01000 [Pseudonocardia sp.]
MLALYEGPDQAEQDTLSKIEPTMADSRESDRFGATWQDMTRSAGRAWAVPSRPSR